MKVREPWCPGLVVMGGDSCTKGRGFESLHRILDGQFFTDICCKNCNDVCLKKTENKCLRGRALPIKKGFYVKQRHQTDQNM